jgi:hypothetical protein
MSFWRLRQGRREGGRAGNFYRGPRLNGGPEELDYGARERQGIKEPYNFYRGPSILSTALVLGTNLFFAYFSRYP